MSSRAKGITLTTSLLSRAKELRQTVQKADDWRANSESHFQKISGMKEYYRRLEGGMQALVARERATRDPVLRTQISVEVIQGNVAGIQADVKVQSTWDVGIVEPGQLLAKEFADQPRTCDTAKELQARGATLEAAVGWNDACQRAQAERAKFVPVLQRLLELRAELKTFQTLAESHRQALIDESTRLQ